MISMIKDFLGFDIKADKYKLSRDPMFGVISDEKKPDKWVFSTCGYCGGRMWTLHWRKRW